MKSLQVNSKLIIYNLKILCDANFLAALALLVIIFSTYNLKFLSYVQVAEIGEHFFPFWGIILLAYVTNIEKSCHVAESIYIQRIPYRNVVFIRILLNALLCFLFIFMVLSVAKIQNCDFPFGKMLWGTWITAMYLGTIALTINTILGNVILGYVVSIAYYFIELYYNGEIFRNFYIFSLIERSFSQKYILLLITVVLIAITLIWTHQRKMVFL